MTSYSLLVSGDCRAALTIVRSMGHASFRRALGISGDGYEHYADTLVHYESPCTSGGFACGACCAEIYPAPSVRGFPRRLGYGQR